MKRWGWVAAGIGFLCVVVMPAAVARFVWQRLPPQKDVTVFASAFGDVVGPLFAALAFAGLIYTTLMQREELSLQREELRETRAELKRTADAQEASEKALQAQVLTAELTARLNAATTLLEHYRSIHIEKPAALSDEDYAEYLEREGEKRRSIKNVLDEIINVRNELRDVVRFEVRANIVPAKGGATAQSDEQVQEPGE